jgi:hypothetical protein
MRKYLSAMSAMVCLLWITGCSSVEKKGGNDGKVKCAEVDKAKQEKTAVDAADLAKRKELAEKLIPTLKLKDSVIRFFDQIKKSQMDMLARQLKSKQIQNADEANRKAMELMNKEMNWDKLKDQFVNFYVEDFSAEELNALIKFYESPIGRKLVDKQPEIQQKSMAITRKLLAETMPKVYKLTKEIIEKQQKAVVAKTPAATPVKAPGAAPAAQAMPLPPLPAASVPAAKNVVPLK